MTPLRVTFTFRTRMVVPTVDKPVDGPLCKAAYQQAYFGGHEDPVSQQYCVGLAKHFVGEQWCFMASNIVFDWAGPPSPLHYIKRQKIEDYFDAADIGLMRKMPGFNSSSGAQKAASVLTQTRQASSATAWLVADDAERVRELIGRLTHLGKLAHHDFGAIKDVAVEQDEEALQRWRSRPLPFGSEVASTSSHALATTALRPPYWQRTNFVPGLLPLGL